MIYKKDLFSTEQLGTFAELLLKNDYRIMVSKGSTKNNKYFYYVKNNDIGYCQEEYFGGLNISTVHKPSRESGTGFRRHEGLVKPTLKHAEEGFITKPSWAYHNKGIKYSSWEDYEKQPLNKNQYEEVILKTKEDEKK